MHSHTTIPKRAAAVTGPAAINRGRTALARAALAVGVLARRGRTGHRTPIRNGVSCGASRPRSPRTCAGTT
jgi:hypothetical protein